MRESLGAAPGVWVADSIETCRTLVGDADWTSGVSDRRTAADAASRMNAVRREMASAFQELSPDIPGDAAPRLVSAAPELALQVSFLDVAFPDARFVYLFRHPESALNDALAEWRSGEAVSHPDLPGWEGPAWSLPLVPNWTDLSGRPLRDVVAEQWTGIARVALDDLEALHPNRWRVVDTTALMAQPDDEIQRLFDWLGLGWRASSSAPWRILAQHTSGEPLEGPTAGWPEAEPAITEVAERAHDNAARTAAPNAQTRPDNVTASDDGLAALLKKHTMSLLVSTYQSNRVMVLRQDKGALNLHLRAFDRPMGLAVTPGGLALGGRAEVWDFRDFPPAAATIEPPGKHDACFLPRNLHYTGDIAIHDLDVGQDGLWVVATRFSCLATLDTHHSFVPRWTPSFITALAPEDRCHLNGLAMVDGFPRYVTALGVTDTPGGWRAHKADGGVIIDVPSGDVVASGLSMPHSPRWHEGRLWVLESGRGRLSVCDVETGKTEPVIELPGFTRGLRFQGRTAFVGTSQVRETATFGGLPISRLRERVCGVWAVDIPTGQLLGSVRFDSHIQEIFDVAVVAGRTFPEIVEPTTSLARETWYVPHPILPTLRQRGGT